MAGFSDKTFTDIALDSLEDAFYVLSLPENGRLVRWNNTFNEVTGYSDEELSKMTVFDFFDEEGKKRQGDFLLLLLKDGHGKLEIDITDKNSNKIPYEFHSTLVKDPVSDEPVAVVGTGRDISKHKEWEARLKESEEKYRQIFEHAIEGIFQTSLDGKIISANPSLARMYGYDSPEQMKEEISDVATQLYADPEYREKFKKLILDTGKVEAFETHFKRRDGEKVWVSINAHTVKGESNNILFIEGTTENITARKKAEEALKESEEKYRLITDNVTDVVWIMDLTTMKRTYTSPSVYKLRGFTPEEVNNLPPDKIATPESLQRLMSVLSAEMEKERQGADPDRTTTFEVEQYNKDGSTVWTEVTAKFLRDENGTPVAITGVGRDIDERKKAEKDLRESEKMFREFADNLPEVVFEADSVGRFLYVNANAINTFGYTEEELYSGSINVVEMISEEYREQAVQRMQMILSEGYQGSSEYMARRKDGSIFPAIISTLPVVKEGVTVGLRRVLTDITAQKEYEDKLNKANKELEGYSQMVSHDLKGPITAISIAHELMARIIESKAPELMDETSEVMQISTRNIDRATRLIDSLLALAETGKPEDTYAVDLNEKVKEILFEKKTELDAKGIEVKADDLGKLVANPTHVYQVFSNLLQNAMRYVDSDNGLIEVKKLDENRYLVRDNGPGISEKVIDDIFVPFVKGVGGDTGLGLSIVKKIVETYGGEIKAYNENGACFEFTLMDYSEEQ